jgi:tRNA A-37 threonylcarbamoyl transferase component Bud32
VIVARNDVVDAIVAFGQSRDGRTLHETAARTPGARPMQGRDVAYALTLPEGHDIVVRHNRHGGALRSLTQDIFLGATRAPDELSISLRLHSLGVPSPQVLAYAVYSAGLGTARSDVVTEEIPESVDFGALLLETDPASEGRRRGWNAVTRLLKRLSAAGVRHHDLNVKNILLRRMPDGLFAGHVLDVDRVEFDCTRRDALAGNRGRLRRSVEKWRRTRGARITESEIEALRYRASSSS